MDNRENIQFGCSSVIQRTDNVFSDEIKKENIKLNKYCLCKGFILVDNDDVNESYLNNSKPDLNMKGTQRPAKNILSSLDNILYATTRNIDSDITDRQLSASSSVLKEVKELSIESHLNLIFSYLNINSIRSEFNVLLQIICHSGDILTKAETKVDSSFPTAQFRLANYRTPYRLDFSDKSGDILVYIKSNIPAHELNWENLCKSIQAVTFVRNLRKERWLVISIYRPPSQNSEFLFTP